MVISASLVPPSNHDDTNRTIYVGNLYKAITPTELMTFFAECGPISNVKIGGDTITHTVRYAFVEFVEPSGMRMALTYGGRMLQGYAIKYVAHNFIRWI